MSKVKIGFSGLTVTEQIERARNITTSMTGNASFPTPSPTLAVVIAANNALETAYNESRGRDVNKMATMRLRRKEMLFLVNQLSAYVQEASMGDEEVIRSSGYDVRSAPTPRPVIGGEVSEVGAKYGLLSGSISVDWAKATNTVIYLITVRLVRDPSSEGITVVTTKTRKEIDGLTPGEEYRIVIRALGRELAGPTSLPVFITAR